MSHLFANTLLEFGVVENFAYRTKITVILTLDLFGPMSLWLWLCALDDDLLLLLVLSVILKMYKYRSVYSCVVILPFSVSNIQKYHVCEGYIFASQAYNAVVVTKPVTWTLDPNRPRKTGSKYNDTLSCVGKHKGSVTMSQKIAVLLHCLLCYFWQKPHCGGHFTTLCRDKG